MDDAPDERHTGLDAVIEAGSYVLVVDSYAPDVGGAFSLEAHITPEGGGEVEPAEAPEEPETTR